MSDDAPQFVFVMRYTSHDDDPYYYQDWYGAKKIEVVAATKNEAVQKARAALGDAPRGRHWAFIVDSIRDILIPPKETS